MSEQRREYNRKKIRSRRRMSRKNRRRRLQFYRAIIVAGMILFVILLVVLGKTVLTKLNNDGQETVQKNDAKNITIEKEKKEEKNEEKSDAVITLAENTVDSLRLGEAFAEPGFTAKDKDGTDLTKEVQVDTSALNRAGKQQVVYTVKDSKGREASAVREIEILPNTEYDAAGLPICMYHYVYEANDPPENLDANFMTTETLEEEIRYLKENDYYFPTWQEVRDYVDGKLLLPEKSIVLCFDDNPVMIELGVPIFEKYQVPVTCFVITSYWDDKEMLQAYKSEYVQFETHSHDMHRGGGNSGHGGIYTAMSHEEIVSDLTKSIEMCGNGNAFAYPFGDYTEDGISALEETGLLCAVTTEPGKSYPGQNPYLLPRVRMSNGQTIDEFVTKIQE